MGQFTLEFAPCIPPANALQFAAVPWDSALFGFPFVELRCGDAPPDRVAAELPGWLADYAPDESCLVYTRIDPLNVPLSAALAACGFFHVEATLDLSFRLREAKLAAEWRTDMLKLDLAGEDDLPAIRSLARTAFTADRLHLDPHLSSEIADQRYVNWIDNAYAAGEMLFTYKDRRSGKLLGFYHARESAPGQVDLALAALDRAYQRVGIGPMLYRDVFTACIERGYETAVTRIALQNTDVLNLYMGFGVRLSRVLNTLHWFRA